MLDLWIPLDSGWSRSRLLLYRQENRGSEKGEPGLQGYVFHDLSSVLGDSCRNGFHWASIFAATEAGPHLPRHEERDGAVNSSVD